MMIDQSVSNFLKFDIRTQPRVRIDWSAFKHSDICLKDIYEKSEAIVYAYESVCRYFRYQSVPLWIFEKLHDVDDRLMEFVIEMPQEASISEEPEKPVDEVAQRSERKQKTIEEVVWNATASQIAELEKAIMRWHAHNDPITVIVEDNIYSVDRGRMYDFLADNAKFEGKVGE